MYPDFRQIECLLYVVRNILRQRVLPTSGSDRGLTTGQRAWSYNHQRASTERQISQINSGEAARFGKYQRPITMDPNMLGSAFASCLTD